MGVAKSLSEKVVLPPEGRWALGVSGGADSVGMLRLCLAMRPEVVAQVVTVDHETRAGASGEDARFVVGMCGRLGIPCTVIRRSEVEPKLGHLRLRGVSARYRAVRHVAFGVTVAAEGLSGVMLAHQAEDVAETVALRLLRGSSFLGLGGIAQDTTIRMSAMMLGDAWCGALREGRLPLRVWRPVLGCTREELRGYLRSAGQTWREDTSNESDDYGRNRVRKVLDADPASAAAILALGVAAGRYREALDEALADGWGSGEVNLMPGVGDFEVGPVGRYRARRYLLRTVATLGQQYSFGISDAVVERFLAWVRDPASGRAMEFPSGIRLRRRGGRVVAEPPDVANSGNVGGA